jgi:hypothetical protein
MVETIFIHKVVRRLEKYLIKKNGFHLLGDTYDLILFVPSDKYAPDDKYSLIISAKKLNTLSQKDVIRELLSDFKESLNFDQYNSISRINIINTEEPFVKNLKFAFSFREEIIEINSIPIGGVQIDFAYLVKSLILDKLIENKTLKLEIINQMGMLDIISVGVVRIEKNFEIVYYTVKGIREMWRQDMTDSEKAKAAILREKSEDYLIQHEYLSKILFDDIQKVI